MGAIWRGSVALLMWTLNLMRTPHSNGLPSSVSSSSSYSKSVWTFLTAGPRGARRQSHAALELLEKFRHGPETHSEWNLFLWRATFPLVSLVFLTLFCVSGEFGHTAYSLVVNPVWYLCNFALVTTPFLVVFRFVDLEDASDAESHAMIWYKLAAVSVAISLVEWSMSMPASRYSWIVGNTLYGIVALGAIPMFFSIQVRTSRSQYETLVRQEQDQDTMHGVLEEEEDTYARNATRRVETSLRMAETTSNAEFEKVRGLEGKGQRHQPMTRLLYGCGFSALLLWLVMFSSYSSAQGGEAITNLWFLLYSLSPLLCVGLFCFRVMKVRFSFEHAVAYSTLVIHIPLFLGQLCVRLFTLAEDATTTSPTSVESWLKLAVSVLYLLLMQGYFFVITHMVNSMSEPFAHPSLLYVGQLYYYVYWYILVGTDTPIDGLYWAMLLLNNVHIAFLNTGMYTDFKRASSLWLATPLHVNLRSSVAGCLRTTTSAITVSKCISRRRVLNEQSLLGLNCGVASAAVIKTQSDFTEVNDEKFNFSSSDGSYGFLSTQNIDDNDQSAGASQPPMWQAIGSHNRERDRGCTKYDRKDILASANPFPPTCKVKKSLSLVEKCSRAHTNCRKSDVSSHSDGEPIVSVASTSNVDSRNATSDTLRPLYFLMKLAEQDNMADTTALILVPSLLTLLAVFEKPGSALSVVQDQMNLWLRCVCMFIGRLGGAFLTREIFTCKLQSRLRPSPEDVNSMTQSDPISGSIDGMPARLWIQRLMLQDFHAQFWYLTAVTIVVTFGCFARMDLPLRFALL